MRVKARMDAGEAVPDCLVKTLLLTQEKEKLDWEDLCMLSAVFTLGGVHSVWPGYSFKLTTKLINSSLIDFRRHSVVPCPHFFIPWCPGQGAHRAWYSNRPRLLAISWRWTAPPVYTRHQQRSTCCTWTRRADCLTFSQCTGIVILQKLFQPYTTVGHFINSVSASSHLSSNSPLQRKFWVYFLFEILSDMCRKDINPCRIPLISDTFSHFVQ